MMVSVSLGRATVWCASSVSPRKMVIRMALIDTSVEAAFLLRGSLKAVMPLEIASMPVSAVQPLENARRMRNRTSGSAARSTACTPVTCGSVPVK